MRRFASRSAGSLVSQFETCQSLPACSVERLHHRRMAVAERGDGDAAREVDVHPAVLVPDARAFAAHRNERRRRVARDHPLVEHRARHGHRRGGARRRRDVAPRRRGDDGLRRREASGGDRGGARHDAGRAPPRRPGSRPCTRAPRASPRRSRAPASAPGTTHCSHTAFIAAKSADVGQVDRRRQDLRLVGAGFGEQRVDLRQHLLRLAGDVGRRVVGDLAREIRGARRAVDHELATGACRRGGVRWSWCYPGTGAPLRPAPLRYCSRDDPPTRARAGRRAPVRRRRPPARSARMRSRRDSRRTRWPSARRPCNTTSGTRSDCSPSGLLLVHKPDSARSAAAGVAASSPASCSSRAASTRWR